MSWKQGREKKLPNILIILVNIIFIIGLVLVFLIYDHDYKEKFYDQNVDDISNINQSSANISSSFFSNRDSKLKDIALYIKENNLTLGQTLSYIRSSNSDEDKVFEIIGEDYKGIQLDSTGEHLVDYSSGYPTIPYIVDGNTGEAVESQQVFFAAEFTDGYTAMKSFGQYVYLNLVNEDGNDYGYTLMLVSQSADFAELLELDTGYDELTTAIVNAEGDYIIGNPNFKSDNFYQYLYVFNNLTLDERNAIRSNVIDSQKGALEYRDSRDRNNVFVYTKVPYSDWYCITAVPIQMFHNRSFDLSFALIAIMILSVLLVMDSTYLFLLNRRLKVSAENERIASDAKTDFLSRMSHDIRTPLNVIIGMSLLAKNEDNPKETKECLKNIDESGNFLLGLVNDILDLNKVESGKMELHPEPYCYSEFCGHINAVVLPLCQSKSINFELMGDMTEQYVMLDRLRVNQIFFNLLSNSVKFTPSGGKIILSCKSTKLEGDRYAFDFQVKDNGIGMSKTFQEHMFEAFSQEQRKETSAIQGTGLGLAIVSNLVNLMNGTMRVESEEGRGTTFFIHIESEVAEYQDKKQGQKIVDDVLFGKRILLCEDHPLNAQIAIRLLERKNMTVEHASDGEVGLSMFQAAPENYYDAILMDIRMPVMDGMETTRRIRALDRPYAADVPIIAMTANAYDLDKKNSFEAGMNAHIAKPINPAIMYETLEQQIARHEKK